MTYGNPKNACGTYQKNSVTALTPVQIVAKLYERLVQDLLLAKQANIASERAVMGEKIGHALAIIGELQANLNFDDGGDISENLNSLYNFLFEEISKATIRNSAEGLSTAIDTVTPLADAWSELAQQKKKSVALPTMGAKPMAAAVAFHATF